METKTRWRDVYKVHPAADLFPILPEDELRKLGEDIKTNGLREAITLWAPGNNEEHGEFLVLDGRNRLDAMELVGLSVIKENKDSGFGLDLPPGKFVASPDEIVRRYYEKRELLRGGTSKPTMEIKPSINPYLYVISQNLRRRHLTKEQQADLIVKAMQAAQSQDELAKRARSFSQSGRGGSTKDALKEKVVEEAKKHGIGKRTAEKALAKAKGRPTQPSRAKQTVAPVLPATVFSEAAESRGSPPMNDSPSVDKEALAKPAGDDPAFNGENLYAVTFVVNGARIPTVKKRISELFPDCKDELEIEKRYAKKSRADLLGEAQFIIEELRDGLQEWRDNLPENFQAGKTADQLDKCIQVLESIISDMETIEFPSAFGS